MKNIGYVPHLVSATPLFSVSSYGVEVPRSGSSAPEETCQDLLGPKPEEMRKMSFKTASRKELARAPNSRILTIGRT
jgi:hypothetical protein